MDYLLNSVINAVELGFFGIGYVKDGLPRYTIILFSSVTSHNSTINTAPILMQNLLITKKMTALCITGIIVRFCYATFKRVILTSL